MTFNLLLSLLTTLCMSYSLVGQSQKIVLPDSFSKANEKKRIVKSIINHKPLAPVPSIVTDHEWKELEGDYFISLVDRTQTALGPWGLRRLTTPHADRAVIDQSAKRLQLLTSDLQLLADVKKQLALFAHYEDALIAYYNPNDALNKNAERLYYSIFKQYLNANRTALEGAYVVDISKVFMMLAGTLCLNGAFQYTCSKWLKGETTNLYSLLMGALEGFREPIRIHNWNFEQLCDVTLHEKCAQNSHEWLSTFMIGSAGDQWALLKDVITPFIASGKVAGGVSGVLIGLKVLFNDISRYLTIKKSGQELWFLFDTANQLQHRLSDVSKLLEIAQDITVLCQDHSEIAQWHEFQVIKNHSYACPELSEKVKKLVELLASKTFLQDNGYIYSRGNVLLAHKLLVEVADDLIEFLTAIAQFDAQVSIATIVQELKEEGRSFAWPQFSETVEPFVNFNDAWNPLITKKNSIENDIYLGNDNAQKIVITGPNGGGKSSTMKTAAWSVMLAQSWAIVPCTKAELSVFTTIKTSLHPQESIKEGLSSFMAEKKRMQEIESCITAQNPTDVQLFLIDEPYHGTVEFEASKRVYDFGIRIANNPCLLMIATHLEKPVCLEYDALGKFANFSMGYSQDEQGNLKRTFKFAPGAADWWFKDSQKRARFIDSLEFN